MRGRIKEKASLRGFIMLQIFYGFPCRLLLLAITISTLPSYAESSFLDQRYRGWLWFEEKSLEHEIMLGKNSITAEEATAEIEILKENMDRQRSIMIARPSPESVRDYVILEELMWNKALALDEAYRQAQFLYPEYFDRIKNPQNVHAIKFKRKLDQEKFEAKIKNFANKFDLVFFSKNSCPYCKEFAPILKHFSDLYGFKTEEASLEPEMTGLFNGKTMLNLAKKLGIKATPTVIAVSKDGKTAFEIIRGYVTTSELEEYAVLASDYVQRLE